MVVNNLMVTLVVLFSLVCTPHFTRTTHPTLLASVWPSLWLPGNITMNTKGSDWSCDTICSSGEGKLIVQWTQPSGICTWSTHGHIKLYSSTTNIPATFEHLKNLKYALPHFSRCLYISNSTLEGNISVKRGHSLQCFYWSKIFFFCGATDTPVLDFWLRLPWVSKPGWILLACFLACTTPQIHLWCNTCWPLDGQQAACHVPYMRQQR